jgi:hypothetical protein
MFFKESEGYFLFSDISNFELNCKPPESMLNFYIISIENPLYESFKAGIKSLRATLPDEIFYWEFCFSNRAVR